MFELILLVSYIGPNPIKHDTAMPTGLLLHTLGWGGAPHSKWMFVLLPQGCIAAASALEMWIGLGPYCARTDEKLDCCQCVLPEIQFHF